MKIFRVASAQPAVQYEQCLLLYLLKLGLIAIVSVLLSPSASVTSCASLNHFFKRILLPAYTPSRLPTVMQEKSSKLLCSTPHSNFLPLKWALTY